MLPLATFTLAVLACLLTGYTLHKTRLVHLLLHELRDQGRQDSAALFRQMEALHALYTELRLRRSLPATRGWAASPDFLLELARHALSERPGVVVECSSGTSTLVLARCLQLNGSGKVYSLEHDPHYAKATRAELLRHGLEDWAEVLDSSLTAQEFRNATWPWYETSGLPSGGIDMLAIDGPPQATRRLARYPAGPALFARLAPDAAVFLDDAKRQDEQEILRRWANEYPEMQQHMLNCEKGAALLRYRPSTARRPSRLATSP
jgi:predicted O-methyltransferase YrrM